VRVRGKIFHTPSYSHTSLLTSASLLRCRSPRPECGPSGRPGPSRDEIVSPGGCRFLRRDVDARSTVTPSLRRTLVHQADVVDVEPRTLAQPCCNTCGTPVRRRAFFTSSAVMIRASPAPRSSAVAIRVANLCASCRRRPDDRACITRRTLVHGSLPGVNCRRPHVRVSRHCSWHSSRDVHQHKSPSLHSRRWM